MQKEISQILRKSLGLIQEGGIAPKHGWAVAPLAQADYLPKPYTVNIFVVKFPTFYSDRFPGSKRGVTFTEIFSTEIISKILPNWNFQYFSPHLSQVFVAVKIGIFCYKNGAHFAWIKIG